MTRPERGAAAAKSWADDPAQLARYTTLGVGGPARTLLVAADEEALVDAVRTADAVGQPLLLLGGGSNLVPADDGFDGVVVRIASRGVEVHETASEVRLRVAAGEPWDDLVRFTVERGWAGLEALSGIPGLSGATPVQNVGAYGAEIADVLRGVRVLDRHSGRIERLAPANLAFGYRDSLLKRTTAGASPRYVVLSIDLVLRRDPGSAPVRYAELARALGVALGERADTVAVRAEVLRLRASKGMVLDPTDRDTFSAGSFFTNPIVPARVAASLPGEAPRFPAGPPSAGAVKVSAAWLIERAGFGKGFGLPGTTGGGIVGIEVAGGRASLSTKHALAVTNRGGATASDVLAIARTVRDGVERRFGIRLEPEPRLVGCRL